MNELTPAVQRALRLWYRSVCGSRRLAKWLDVGEHPPQWCNGNNQSADDAYTARIALTTEERVALTAAVWRVAKRLGWVS